MLFLTLAWRTWVPRVRRYFFLSSSPGVLGYGSVLHEPLPITNISSPFFRRRGEGWHFRFRAPANHLASTSPPGQAILLGLLDVTQVRLLLIQTAVIPLPSSRWDITWHTDWQTYLAWCFFCKQSRYYIICSLVNTVDKIIFFPFKSIEEKRRCSLLWREKYVY